MIDFRLVFAVLLAVLAGWGFASGTGSEISPVDETVFRETVQKTAEIRGLKFLESVPLKRMSRDRIASLFEKELERLYTGEELEHIRISLSLLGAVPEELDIRKMLLGLMTEQVAGVYDPIEKEMMVVGEISLEVGLVRTILEHELTHALTDQHFDLRSLPIEDKKNDDRALAALALVEGDATISMLEYTRQLGVQGILSTFLLSLFIDQDLFSAAPPFYQGWLTFPYVGGDRFLRELMRRYQVEDGRLVPRTRRLRGIDWEVVNFVYTDPPASTEQVLHPEKFFEKRDLPRPVESSLVEKLRDRGWKLLWENTLGEFLLRTWMQETLRLGQARRAAQGWGGDRYFLLEKQGEYLIVWVTSWDTSDDREEFFRSCARMMEEGRFPGRVFLRRLPEENGVSIGISRDLEKEKIETLLSEP